jgi:phosphatidyl-myo-inositol dimannoside synthase
MEPGVDKKNILVLVWEFPPGPGGIGNHAYSFSKAFAKKGFHVTVLTAADYVNQEEVDTFDRDQKTLAIVRIKGWFFFKYLKRFFLTAFYCLKLKPEEVVCSGRTALWLISLVKFISSRKTRTSAFLHGSEIERPGFLDRSLTRYSIDIFDRVFCVSTFTKNLLPPGIRNKNNVQILPNGLDLENLHQLNLMRNTNFSGSPALLTVGQLTRRKGQHRIIQALPLLIETWPNLKYHMVGLDTNKHELSLMATNLGVEQHIVFHGRLNDQGVYNAYESTDIFIMLSENQKDGDVEGFGIAILEANFFGRTAIGAKGCGIEDAIEDGVNGFLVDGDNALEIQSAIMRCLANKSEMQPQCRSWAMRHDWNNLILTFQR